MFKFSFFISLYMLKSYNDDNIIEKLTIGLKIFHFRRDIDVLSKEMC